MDADEAGRLINRLRRVEGQSRGLQRMIEEGRPCEEIFTQLAATKAALDRVGVLLISLKMRECLAEEAGEDLAHNVPDHGWNKALTAWGIVKFNERVAAKKMAKLFQKIQD